ncbi:hypothetical protein EH207_17280 [Brenneria rubrifaciens]|uniref:Filamentous hemagglutinin n=1 Tax=Brenneria rubrifaciens TaxID=55213 RepID=A0A4P8QSE2_9GAMM|nr:hemagglutinin repeat-containing protein [Brenneria rubrifaciens]QCR10097.1 hypothetical protein EH207_17280 [Brenneria rubrifaciens]
MLQLDADTITNQTGAIQGADVSLNARTDINNIGGIIQGNDRLLASAGRDINATTTLRSVESAADQNRFARTTIDSVSGIYVQVSGETVKADVGRNLTMTSEQDSDRYDAKQQNAGAGGSFTFGSMSGSASVNLSRDKMHSNYDSVVEQTGIFAGKGGFDVTVGEHTRLDGAVMGSTAAPDKNRLDTGTLGVGVDIPQAKDFTPSHGMIYLRYSPAGWQDDLDSPPQPLMP